MLEGKVSAAKKLDQVHAGYLTLLTNGNQWALCRVASTQEAGLSAYVIQILEVEDPSLAPLWQADQLVEVEANQVYFLCTLFAAEAQSNYWWNKSAIVNTHLDFDAPMVAWYVAVHFNHESRESACLAARVAGAAPHNP